jgi:hypothetical protein
MSFAFGRPTCGRALRWGVQLADVPLHLHCVGAPNLRTCLRVRQNLFLSILHLVFYPSAPLCGRFRCG